ncbi:MAG: PilT/PilU family type 4a pilus ATPase [Chromatiales bacterium]|nr:PilT/PilU family type 4a pilus ATPase [Chromatiales bacterium]
MNIRKLFELMVEKEASDIFFTTYASIKIKIEGQILSVNKTKLTPEAVKDAAYGLMNVEQQKVFARELEIDFAISEPGLGRFRVNIFHQRGNLAMVVRYITMDMPVLEELGMPEKLAELSLLKRGLVLMVGATGHGKSTTLAAMINNRNANTSSHILTIEDPIEFLHPNKKSIVNQREVGIDTTSYSRALKSAVRAAPDVILIGEIRDQETMEAAISLSGSGHLCLATLHANNSTEALDRIINMFPQQQHDQIFLDLSQYLKAIISQRLVQGVSGRRSAAVEILLNTPHISELVLKGDISAIKEALVSSTESGMQSFDQSLLNLHKAGQISLEDALANADSRSNLEARINFG